MPVANEYQDESTPTVKPITNSEALQMMKAALRQIEELTATIAFLAPRSEAYGLLAVVIGTGVPRNYAASGTDMADQLKRRIKELDQYIADAKRVLS